MMKLDDLLTEGALQQGHNLGIKDGTYVGIDASLTNTGVAVIDPDYLTTWNIKPTDDLRGAERLDWYDGQLQVLMMLYPSAVAVEDYSFGSPNKAHQMGELGGMVRLMLWRTVDRCYTVAPATLKKFIKGTGKGGKEGLSLHMYKTWGVEVEQPDQVDAAGLALMCAHRCNPHLDLIKPRREAEEKMAFMGQKRRPIRTRSRV